MQSVLIVIRTLMGINKVGYYKIYEDFQNL